MGPLAGVSFISAARTYAEISVAGGEVLSPLIGVWAPTFSACELASVFLLPFVAIRLVAGDRQSGASKLEMQQGMSPFARIAAKTLVLTAAWILALLIPFSAVALWISSGGSLHPLELLALAAGHCLNAALAISLAAAMASLAEHPATAAILTLSITVGTWIVSFVGAIQGGWWERAAGYTPSAMVAEFQHGLLRLDSIAIVLSLTLADLAIAALWMRTGTSINRRLAESLGVLALAALAVFAGTNLIASWDLSENRANSFPLADELALRRIQAPLRMEIHLAPEDPRRTDLERKTLLKLRRVLPNIQVTYISATSTGLFEQATPGYGEIHYQLGDRKETNRSTTTEGVLQTLYTLSGVTPANVDAPVYRGQPLAVAPKGAGALFYVLWPSVVLIAAISARRRLS